MVSSRVYPSLERKKGGPDNWVEKAGGLPDFIERIAKHLHYESGMTISHAIATAVSQCKKNCAKGNAKACKAIAQWESKKARVRVDATDIRGRKLTDIEFSEVLGHVIQESIDLAGGGIQRGSGASGSGKAFDERKYVRNPGTGQFGQKFNAAQMIAARRSIEGNITNLVDGQSYELPGQTGWVRKMPGGYMIQGGAGIRLVVKSESEAVEAAAALLAGKLAELGGKK